MSFDDAFQARATHASHRTRLRGFGLSVGIAIALAGCDGGKETYWSECVFTPTGEHFIVLDHSVRWPRVRDRDGYESNIDIEGTLQGAPVWRCRRA